MLQNSKSKIIPLHKKRQLNELILEFLDSWKGYEQLEPFLIDLTKRYPDISQDLQAHLKKVRSKYKPDSLERFQSLAIFVNQTLQNEIDSNEKKIEILDSKSFLIANRLLRVKKARTGLESYLKDQKKQTTATLYRYSTGVNYLYEAEKTDSQAVYLIRIPKQMPFTIEAFAYTTNYNGFHKNLPLQSIYFPLPDEFSSEEVLHKAQVLYRILDGNSFDPMQYETIFEKLMTQQPQDMEYTGSIIYQGYIFYSTEHEYWCDIQHTLRNYWSSTHVDYTVLASNPLKLYFKLREEHDGNNRQQNSEKNTSKTLDPNTTPQQAVLAAKQALREYDEYDCFPPLLNEIND